MHGVVEPARSGSEPYWKLVCWCGLMLGLPATAGCGRVKEISPLDAPAIERLRSYKPDYELDRRGRVWRLKLEGPQVRDEALEYAKDLSELKSLSLYSSSITDNGIAKLPTKGQIEEIGLVSTRITDRGLKHLAKMASLQRVWVSEDSPHLTQKGVDALQKALPGLTIYRQ